MSKSLNILISGGAQGIGRAFTRHFLQTGHRVFILDINEQELRHATEVHLKDHSSSLASGVCNLRDVSDIRRTVSRAADFFGGRIDVLINNGGIAHPRFTPNRVSMDDPATMAQWQAYVETNLTAPFAMSQACLPHMKTTTDPTKVQGAGPCIIHMSSFRAYQSEPN